MANNKQEWTEIEFADMAGMSTNPINPGRKFGRRLLNVHSHKKPGALTLRAGYALKYAVPDLLLYPNIGGNVFLNFGLFTDKQIDPNGKEITCLIQMALVTPEGFSGLPGVINTQPMLNFWIRPYWNGSAWIDEWQWLNQTIITKIVTG